MFLSLPFACDSLGKKWKIKESRQPGEWRREKMLTEAFSAQWAEEAQLTFRRTSINQNEASNYHSDEDCDFFHYNCRENGVGLGGIALQFQGK